MGVSLERVWVSAFGWVDANPGIHREPLGLNGQPSSAHGGMRVTVHDGLKWPLLVVVARRA